VKSHRGWFRVQQAVVLQANTVKDSQNQDRQTRPEHDKQRLLHKKKAAA
jgi:hypothetical protein